MKDNIVLKLILVGIIGIGAASLFQDISHYGRVAALVLLTAASFFLGRTTK